MNSTPRPELRDSALLEHRPKRLWFYVPISALIGVVITVIVGLSNPSALDPPLFNLLVGAFIGAVIGASAIYGELLLMKALRPRRRGAVQLSRIVGYGVGGALGYTVAGLTIDWVLGVQATWNRGSFASISLSAAVFGAFSVGIGLVFQTFERLRGRLEESVAQLKEAEFAAKELVTARDIQRRLLPPERLEGEGFSLRCLNRAASVVAGDFYDYIELPDGQVLFAIGDVSGKGMGASLIMATVKARLPLMLAHSPLEEVATRLNRQLLADAGPREFVALLLGRFDPSSGRLEWLNSGLPDPLLIAAPGTASIELESRGDRLPLGLRSSIRPAVASCVLQPGGRLLFYTDGLPEALNLRGEPQGYEWLRGQVDLSMQSSDPALQLLERVLGEPAEPAVASGSADPEDQSEFVGPPADGGTPVAPGEGARTPDVPASTAPQDDCTVMLLEWTRARTRGPEELHGSSAEPSAAVSSARSESSRNLG